MKLGSIDVAALKVGSTNVSKAYLGSTLVWEAGEDPGGGTDPYEYYRLHVLVAETGQRVYVAEWELRSSLGGASIATGGTPTASSSFSGQPASLAFDGDVGTSWISNTSQSLTTQQWLQYQLGAAAGIAQYAITANTTVPARTPLVFVLLGSNDGSTWVPLDAREEAAWSAGEERAYVPSFDVTGKYRYWRLRFTANNGDARVGTRRVELREEVDGSQRAVYGLPSSSSNFTNFGPERAFGSDLDGNGWLSNGGVPQWLQYDFGVFPRSIVQYSVAISGASSPANKSPQAWVLEASNNGSDWTEIDSVSGQTAWQTNEVRVFTV